MTSPGGGDSAEQLQLARRKQLALLLQKRRQKLRQQLLLQQQLLQQQQLKQQQKQKLALQGSSFAIFVVPKLCNKELNGFVLNMTPQICQINIMVESD